MRANALTDMLSFIDKYLSAVDSLREVKYSEAACFVVHTECLASGGDAA